VYVTDGGNTSLWAGAVLPPTQPRSYHSILELGMLGTGIPSAIGAKLGHDLAAESAPIVR
jgi:acetolactate synthase-1/2/3 large subunit